MKGSSDLLGRIAGSRLEDNRLESSSAVENQSAGILGTVAVDSPSDHHHSTQGCHSSLAAGDGGDDQSCEHMRAV